MADPTQAPASILVVDDNPMNRDMLGRRLQRQGYAVTPAEDGEQALALLRTRPFDLVFLDIMMPGLDGYQVLEAVKADPTLAAIPVIMISALDDMESIVRCIQMGADDYLPKPFNPTLLQARAAACLGKKRAHDREQALFQEVERAYSQLQQTERQRDDLTHMVIHDLRTPLTSVMAGLHTLEALGPYDELQAECLGICRSNSETLLGMINDLLDISKMEGGTLTLTRQALAPAVLIAEAVGQITSLAQEQDLALVQEVAPDASLVLGDPEALRRVLVNLLGNAAKFTPAGGRITVGARPTEGAGELTFFVRDTGRGIPKEAFGRIFEKFGQVDTHGAPRARLSTGLGLTFCKLAVDAHGGRIWVESEVGAGSTFLFTIPVGE